MKSATRLLYAALFGVLLTAAAAPSMSQDYPSRPIRFIVNMPPGGLNDVLARLMAPAMAKNLGQGVIVETMPGAGGSLALEYIAKRAPADGYAMGMTSQLVTFPIFMKELRFEPLKDLLPVSMLLEGVSLLATPYGAPWNSYEDMVTYARANPGRINYGSSGLQSQTTLSLEAIKQKHGIDITNVPYQGAGPYMQALIANEVQMVMYGEFRANPDAEAKKIRVLAVSAEKRLPQFPNAPTFIELGIPEVQNYWYAALVAAATPRPIVNRLHASLVAAMNAPEMRAFLNKSNLYVIASTPEEAIKRLEAEGRFNAAVAKKAGIQSK